MSASYFAGLRAPLLIAHRGGALVAPENTLPAFSQALARYRADVLELDLHLTRDGELVVAHDATLDRCTDGSGPIAELTFAELSRLDAGHRFTSDGVTFPFRAQGVRVPRWVEVLRSFPQARFNVELKPENPGIEDAFADLVLAERAAGRVCCGSEDDALAGRLFAALPEARHFYPRDALTAYVLSARAGEPPTLDARFTVLDMPLEYEGVRLFDAQLREVAASTGRWVNVWTVDDPAEMQRLISEGVGGIMTDRPDLLRRVLSEEG